MSLLFWLPLNGDCTEKIKKLSLNPQNVTSHFGGKIGYSCYFDGTASITHQLSAENINRINKANSNLSISCWVNLSTTQQGWGQIITLGSQGTSWNDIRLGFDNQPNAQVWFTVSQGTQNEGYSCGSKRSLQDNQWHHLAGTYDMGKMKFYIDGELTSEYTTGIKPTLSSESYFTIGGNGKNGSYERMVGRINDVRVYDHVLSAKEIKLLAQGLQVHYKLDNNTYKNTSYEWDCSGFENRGSYAKNAASTEAGARNYGSRIFSNENYLKAFRYSDTSESTTSVWVKIPSYPVAGSNQLVFSDATSHTAFGFYGGNAAIISCGYDSSHHAPIVNNLKSAWDGKYDKWHLITVVKKNGNYSFYFDGEKWSDIGGEQYWTCTGSEELTIGCRNNNGYANFFNGELSDFRFYTMALSDEEILSLYHSSIQIGKDGSVFSSCFMENDQSNKFYKNGILSSPSFYEAVNENVKITNGAIQATRLQEL